MRSFSKQLGALVRTAQLPQPPAFRRIPALSCYSISRTPCRFQSNLPSSKSKDHRTNDWARVIEEYKKDKARLAQDLGVALPIPVRLRAACSHTHICTSRSEVDYSQNWVQIIEEYKSDKQRLAQDLGLAPTGHRRYFTRKNMLKHMTLASFIASIAEDVVWYVVIFVVTPLYYIITGKERRSAKSEEPKGNEPAQDVEGNEFETWLSEPENES